MYASNLDVCTYFRDMPWHSDIISIVLAMHTNKRMYECIYTYE